MSKVADDDAEKHLEPLWEAMGCPDVTDDPFYDDFDKVGE